MNGRWFAPGQNQRGKDAHDSAHKSGSRVTGNERTQESISRYCCHDPFRAFKLADKPRAPILWKTAEHGSEGEHQQLCGRTVTPVNHEPASIDHRTEQRESKKYFVAWLQACQETNRQRQGKQGSSYCCRKLWPDLRR